MFLISTLNINKKKSNNFLKEVYLTIIYIKDKTYVFIFYFILSTIIKQEKKTINLFYILLSITILFPSFSLSSLSLFFFW
jgi:hypothetical protein